MKKFVIDFFRKFPFCTGLLSLLIALHLTGVKDLRTPMVAMQEDLFLIFAFYAFAMLFFALFILPETEQQKREKLTRDSCLLSPGAELQILITPEVKLGWEIKMITYRLESPGIWQKQKCKYSRKKFLFLSFVFLWPYL